MFADCHNRMAWVVAGFGLLWVLQPKQGLLRDSVEWIKGDCQLVPGTGLCIASEVGTGCADLAHQFGVPTCLTNGRALNQAVQTVVAPSTLAQRLGGLLILGKLESRNQPEECFAIFGVCRV